MMSGSYDKQVAFRFGVRCRLRTLEKMCSPSSKLWLGTAGAASFHRERITSSFPRRSGIGESTPRNSWLIYSMRRSLIDFKREVGSRRTGEALLLDGCTRGGFSDRKGDRLPFLLDAQEAT